MFTVLTGTWKPNVTVSYILSPWINIPSQIYYFWHSTKNLLVNCHFPAYTVYSTDSSSWFLSWSPTFGLRIPLYSVRMPENEEQKNSEHGVFL